MSWWIVFYYPSKVNADDAKRQTNDTKKNSTSYSITKKNVFFCSTRSFMLLRCSGKSSLTISRSFFQQLDSFPQFIILLLSASAICTRFYSTLFRPYPMPMTTCGMFIFILCVLNFTRKQSDGEENITKLEKADILELTVRHFHNLKRQNKFYIKSEQSYADRFRDGFSQCAKEVTKFLYGQRNHASEHIVLHLNECIRRLDGLANGIQINNNNNNYLTNDSNVHLDLQPQQPFMSLTHHHHLHQSTATLRQPIPLTLRQTSPSTVSLPIPSTSPPQHDSIQIGSPSMLHRPVSRDSMSSTSSNDQKDDQKNCWRPWWISENLFDLIKVRL